MIEDGEARKQASQAQAAAIRLLSRREYSRAELSQRLSRKGFAESVVNRVLDELAREGLQSETRFAEALVRSKLGRDYGPMRIYADAHAKGLDTDLVDQALDEAEVDWVTMARRQACKRYGDLAALDWNEKQKCRAMLARRGFESGHIRAAVP